MSNPTTRTPEKTHRFLEALSASRSVAAACRAATYTRSVAYVWRRDDADFSAAWDEAVKEGTDALEDIAFDRAAAGQSDVLTIFLLKARRPQKYRENARAEHSGPNGGPVETREISNIQRAKALAFIFERAEAEQQSGGER